MSFAWPELLWLLLVLPLLVAAYVWLLRRKRKSALRYANLSMVKEAMGPGAAIRRHVPPALLLVALALLIVAMARPAARTRTDTSACRTRFTAWKWKGWGPSRRRSRV